MDHRTADAPRLRRRGRLPPGEFAGLQHCRQHRARWSVAKLVPPAPTVFDLRGVSFAAWTLAASLFLRQHYPRPADHPQPQRARFCLCLLGLSLLLIGATIWLVHRRAA